MERVLGRQFSHLLTTNSLLLAPSWPTVRKFSRRLPRVRARYTAAVAITSGRAGCLKETLAYSSTCSRESPRTPRVPVAAANPKRNWSSRAGADAIPASWRLGPPAARVAPSGCTAPRPTHGRQAAPAYGATRRREATPLARLARARIAHPGAVGRASQAPARPRLEDTLTAATADPMRPANEVL